MTVELKDIKPFPTYREIRSKDLDWINHRSDKYWDYRKKWVDYPKNLFLSDFPLHLDVETTNLCNLECPMCSRTVQIKEGTYVDIGTMGMDLYKKMIDEGAENGLCSLKLNFLGEPLSDPHIVERVKYAKDKGILDVMFNTNAALLDEKMSYKILEAGIDDVFFSFDSIDPSKYNKIRVGTDFDTVVNNIKNFVRIIKDEGYNHVQTRSSMVVLPGTTKQELEDYKNFWLPIVGIVGFDEWVDHSSQGENSEYSDYNPDFVCSQPYQRLFVMWDGVSIPCCLDVKRAYSLGNANDLTLKEIWHGEKLNKMRDIHLNGDYREIDMCKTCYIPHATTGS